MNTVRSQLRKHAWIALPAGILLVAGVIAFTILQRGAAGTTAGLPTKIVSCKGTESASFSCWQNRYQAMVNTGSPERAYVDFKAQYETNPYIKSNCHQIGHVIGRAAAQKYPTLAETYKHGDQFCWSGFYHGAIEAVAQEIGEDQILAKMTSVCEDFYKQSTYNFDHYNCVHGMGHGLMAIQDGELFVSLKSCDTYTDPWERSSCYGGVFMENVMNEINPGKHSSYLKQDEPLYPCTAVDTAYKEQCYLMQTSHALLVVNQDYKRVFELCDGVEAPYDAICFQSLGRDVSGQSSSEVARTVELCMLGPDIEARRNCFSGAVKDFMSYFHDDKKALEMCAAIPDPELAAACTSEGVAYYKTF